MEPPQKNPNQERWEQEDAPSNSQQPTVPSGSYDYSHLRETKAAGHWYASPPTDVTQPTLMTEYAPTPSIPAPMPPPPQQPPSNAAYYPMRGGSARQRIDRRQRRRASGMPENWAWVVIASALLGVTVVGSMLLVFVIRYALRDGSDETLLADAPLIEPTSIISGEAGGALEGNSLEIQTKKWDGKERFTILVMGLDKRPNESGTAFRTDTMILISLDPKTNSIGILSIPRDLFVEVPYAGLQRVNAAYVIGELEEPGGGATLAKQTVQYNFGIRVNEYVTVEFQTVIALVNAVGGIEIEVPNAFTDYTYPTMDYGTEVFHVDAGWQKMDGETALKYARSRHSSDDIDRAKRQQQVIFALRDKVISLDMVDDLILQAPFLYNELRSGVNTGLTLDQIIELGLWAADVPRENIRTGVVSWEYLIGYETPGGANVLVPNRARIGELMVQVFGADYNQ